MERANRVSVAAQENGGYEARFFRTHKQVGTVDSTTTAWVADTKQNRTLQREMFRVWVCEHSAEYEIVWDPNDNRSDENRRSPKYTTDAILQEDAANMVRADIEGFIRDSKIAGLELKSLVGEDIVPMTKTAKGADLSRMSIEGGKYGNGNWAWATISVVATIGVGESEGYITMECQLVSGQLKKPTSIDGGGYTVAGFRAAATKELGITETKTEESTTAELVENDNGDTTCSKCGNIVYRGEATCESCGTEIEYDGSDLVPDLQQ